ncbi:universal stress protein [Conexibacter sp. CPCC 206217]|uniref:universal stress protein n=1 Tax=Conexibacter sp. CPCC 206217 TaxID=3064574 RepID=UPI002722E98B|nr:universal stress protein [Conexibacter sp. CPCC 206217]MDO8213575.1 universal stress protein [Conexibacter sp. CPCC 206217]
MFRTIVAGFDGSPSARDGLALAELLARVCSARLTAASVYVFHPIHRDGDREMEQYMREEVLARLEGVEKLAPAPVAQPLAVRGHSVPEGLQHAARTLPADLIVIGSTHRGPIGRVLAGDVPQRLLHGAACPVAIAPRGYADGAQPVALRTIGVGFEGSREAHAALAAAAELARAAGAQLRVITAFDPHLSELTPRVLAELQLAEYLAEGRQRLADTQAAAVAALEDVEAVALQDDGEAAEVLAARSHELDLLVLGSRCYGPWRRLMLGSVSTRLTRDAACPLLLLPRTATPPGGAEGEPENDTATQTA